MGRRKRRARPRLWRAMARLAWRKRRTRRSDRQGDLRNKTKSFEPAFDCERVESGRDRQDGVAAVSRALSILRAGRRTKLPALPAQRRFISRRPVQHRIVFAAHVDGGASCRSYAGRFRPHLWRSASLPKPSRAGTRTAHSRLSTFAADEIESSGQRHSRFQIRRFRAHRLRPAPVHQSANRGLRLFPAARVEIIVRPFWRIASVLLLLFELTPLRAQDSNPFTVEIDLQEQTAYLIQDGRVVLSTPI